LKFSQRAKAHRVLSKARPKKSSAEEIKKIRKLASSRNIRLKELRKKYCKKCNSLFNSNNSIIRIKKGFKIIKCENCLHISRYKLR
jgi:RNase P subunit RPR2